MYVRECESGEYARSTLCLDALLRLDIEGLQCA